MAKKPIKRKKVNFTDYQSKPMYKGLITLIRKVQREEQLKENSKFGNKSQKISFVYASKILTNRLKRGENI